MENFLKGIIPRDKELVGLPPMADFINSTGVFIGIIINKYRDKKFGSLISEIEKTDSNSFYSALEEFSKVTFVIGDFSRAYDNEKDVIVYIKKIISMVKQFIKVLNKLKINKKIEKGCIKQIEDDIKSLNSFITSADDKIIWLSNPNNKLKE